MTRRNVILIQFKESFGTEYYTVVSPPGPSGNFDTEDALAHLNAIAVNHLLYPRKSLRPTDLDALHTLNLRPTCAHCHAWMPSLVPCTGYTEHGRAP